MREKAAESRHDELSAYLMFIAGSILFIGGILETLFVADWVEWVLFIPVGLSPPPGCVLGLALTLSGLLLAVFGLVAGTYFARGRAWYMCELSQSDFPEKLAVSRKKNRTRRRK